MIHRNWCCSTNLGSYVEKTKVSFVDIVKTFAESYTEQHPAWVHGVLLNKTITLYRLAQRLFFFIFKLCF